MNYIESLQKRYSVKKFDSTKKVPAVILRNILEAGKLSASSMGLQPYKILVVETQEMKEKLIPAYHNPSQVSTCSHLIVIVAKKEIETQYIDGYFKHITEIRNVPAENLTPFRGSINYFLNVFQKEEVAEWTEKQCYIVLANLMFASALESVDTCPMEGFIAPLIDEILGLDPEKEKVAVTLALGYRSDEDIFQHMKKVRKPDDKLFKFL